MNRYSADSRTCQRVHSALLSSCLHCRAHYLCVILEKHRGGRGRPILEFETDWSGCSGERTWAPSMSGAGMVTAHSASCCQVSAGTSAAAAAAAASSIAAPGSTARPLTCGGRTYRHVAPRVTLGVLNWHEVQTQARFCPQCCAVCGRHSQVSALHLTGVISLWEIDTQGGGGN